MTEHIEINMIQVTILTTALHKQEIISVRQFSNDGESIDYINQSLKKHGNDIDWNVDIVE